MLVQELIFVLEIEHIYQTKNTIFHIKKYN